MPEYLAPGVYVEETSFRAKSIEGVSTSTTAFVGPTHKGPIDETPELLTSFGDFERTYGGLDDLILGNKRYTNYLAHAVRAYFNEGGSRLYVARAFMDGGGANAASPQLIKGAAAADEQAMFVSRVPGALGQYRVGLRLIATPAVKRTLDRALPGSAMRAPGGQQLAAPARLASTQAPPFSLANDTKLILIVDNGAAAEIDFHGEPAVATAQQPLVEPVPLTANNNKIEVEIDGFKQVITLPSAGTPRAQVAQALNDSLRGGSVALDGGNHLVIKSDRWGKASEVKVKTNQTLGFTADLDVKGDAINANNVPDLGAVSLADINALLQAKNIPVVAAQDGPGQPMFLSTTQAGGTASIAISANPASAHEALGWPAQPPAAVTGQAGSTGKYFLKSDSGDWLDSNGARYDKLDAVTDDQAAPQGSADLLTLTVTVEDPTGNVLMYEDLAFGPRHPRYIGNVFSVTPTRRDSLQNPFALTVGKNVSGYELLGGLTADGADRFEMITGGSAGGEPNAAAYSTAFEQLRKLEDISIMAAPGASAFADGDAIQKALINEVDNPKFTKYRIAVLDSAPGATLTQVRTMRGSIDSTRAALYYPWVWVSNPLARPGIDPAAELLLPPSGFVCGVYARTDVERGVFKAPANEVVRSALRFEAEINFAEQEVLNPLGVNCLRYLSGRGYRVGGLRTISSDPEWKYVNVRRYFNYLEASIDRGMQWAVFEPNGERLWANVRDTVGAFLYNEWVSGALLGATAQEAFFVRCDRSTMTQNDLDNGRLICLIGVAALKPAEFVIFRIGQKTADARA